MTGDGTIAINGTGSGAGTINNDGIEMSAGTDLTVEDGVLTLVGTGGAPWPAKA